MKIKVLVFSMMFFGAVCASAFLAADAEAGGTSCIYCKQSNVFGDCTKAPSNAKDNPKRQHKYQSNGKNCVWCQLQNSPQKCAKSPDGKHQL